MALVTTTEMFKKAYDGGYAISAFNMAFNMEIVQGITEAAGELEVSGLFCRFPREQELMPTTPIW